MFESILVPLDATESAEVVLPWVRRLAAAYRPHLYLLGVVAPPSGSGTYAKGQWPERPNAAASEALLVDRVSGLRGHLDAVAAQLGGAGTHVLIREGEPGAAIVGTALEVGASAIVLALGEGPPAREGNEALAALVARASGIPVVLVAAAPAEPAVIDTLAAVGQVSRASSGGTGRPG